MLNYPTALMKVEELPRAIPNPYLDAQVSEETLALMRVGPPSAAEELFGVQEAAKLQNDTTGMYLHQIIQRLSR